MGFHDSLVPLVDCAGWASKCRPKKKVIIKVSHSVVAEGTVCVWGGGGGVVVQRPSGMTGISAISFNLFFQVYVIYVKSRFIESPGH